MCDELTIDSIAARGAGADAAASGKIAAREPGLGLESDE
jgi:hypothetical protein